MTDIFKTIGDGFTKLGTSTMSEIDRIGATTDKNIRNDFTQMDKGMKNGGALGFLVEAADVFSPGHQTANTLENLHVIGDDPKLKEGISAGVNVMTGLALSAATAGTAAPLLALAGCALGAKDLADMMGNGAGNVAMAPAHGTPTPRDQFRSNCIDGTVGARRRGAIDEAKGKITERRREAREEAIEQAKEKIRARRDGYAAGYDAGFQMGYESGYLAALQSNDEHFGKDKTDQVESEIDKILSNPNLCFEDMIFALLRAVIKQGQGDVKEIAKDLKKGRDEEGVIKEDYQGLITSKTNEIANEKDPARKNDLQNQLQNLREERAEKLSARSESRAEVAEDLKNLMAKLTEMQQALSNILNTQHEGAMSAIRNIK